MSPLSSTQWFDSLEYHDQGPANSSVTPAMLGNWPYRFSNPAEPSPPSVLPSPSTTQEQQGRTKQQHEILPANKNQKQDSTTRQSLNGLLNLDSKAKPTLTPTRSTSDFSTGCGAHDGNSVASNSNNSSSASGSPYRGSRNHQSTGNLKGNTGSKHEGGSIAPELQRPTPSSHQPVRSPSHEPSVWPRLVVETPKSPDTFGERPLRVDSRKATAVGPMAHQAPDKDLTYTSLESVMNATKDVREDRRKANAKVSFGSLPEEFDSDSRGLVRPPTPFEHPSGAETPTGNQRYMDPMTGPFQASAIRSTSGVNNRGLPVSLDPLAFHPFAPGALRALPCPLISDTSNIQHRHGTQDASSSTHPTSQHKTGALSPMEAYRFHLRTMMAQPKETAKSGNNTEPSLSAKTSHSTSQTHESEFQQSTSERPRQEHVPDNKVENVSLLSFFPGSNSIAITERLSPEQRKTLEKTASLLEQSRALLSNHPSVKRSARLRSRSPSEELISATPAGASRDCQNDNPSPLLGSTNSEPKSEKCKPIGSNPSKSKASSKGPVRPDKEGSKPVQFNGTLLPEEDCSNRNHRSTSLTAHTRTTPSTPSPSPEPHQVANPTTSSTSTTKATTTTTSSKPSPRSPPPSKQSGAVMQKTQITKTIPDDQDWLCILHDDADEWELVIAPRLEQIEGVGGGEQK